jgi:sugar lactone lactonase YvrE
MNHHIRKLLPAVAALLLHTVCEGQHLTRWLNSGQSTNCTPERFSKPSALLADRRGNLFIAETGGPIAIERLAADGLRTSVVTSKDIGTHIRRLSLALAGLDELLVASSDQIFRLTLAGNEKGVTLTPLTTAARGVKGGLPGITSVATMPSGGFVFTRGRLVMKVDEKGGPSVLAGSNGASVSTDGKGARASFASPQTVIAIRDGSLLVADGGDLDAEGRSYAFGVVRAIDKSGNVSTFAGDYEYGDTGNIDGLKAEARMPYLRSIAQLHRGGLVLIQDQIAMVRLIDEDGVVSTLFGQDKRELKDAELTALAVDESDNIYFSDATSGYLYKATTSGALFKLCSKN